MEIVTLNFAALGAAVLGLILLAVFTGHYMEEPTVG